MNPKTIRFLTTGPILVGLATSPAFSANIDWDNGGGTGEWDLNTNWVGDVLPGGGDNVFLDVSGAAVKVINLSATPTNAVINEVGLARTGNGTATVNHTGGTITVNSWFNLGQGFGGAPANGTGVWTMSGNAVVNATHSNGGLTTIAPGFTASGYNTGVLNIGGNAHFNQTAAAIHVGGEGANLRGKGIVNLTDSGKLTNTSTLVVGVAGNGSTGVVNMSGTSTLTASQFYLGVNNGATGAIRQTGGAASTTAGGANTLAIGTSVGGFGAYSISGGTLTSNEIAVAGIGGGSGILDLSSAGSINNTGWMVMNRSEGGGSVSQSSVLNVSGGNLSFAGNGLVVNWGANGAATQRASINVSGTGSIATSNNTAINLGWGVSANNVATLNLNGGTVTTARVFGNQSYVNFNGGTLRASSSQSSFVAVTNAQVRAGGAVIDSNGFDITINQSLLAPSDSGVTTIAVTDGGSGYISAPVLTITGGTGSGATAIANMVDDGTGNGTFRIDSITVTGAGNYTVAPGAISQTGGAPTTAATFGSIGIAANVSGGLTKNGSGTLTLAGNNSYTGTTLVNAGTLVLSGTNSNGNIQVNGPTSVARITAGSSTFASTSGNSFILGGASLVIDGGAVAITGASSWFSVGDHPTLPDGNGEITINAGSFTNSNSWGITVGAGSAGSGTININGGTFTANDGVQNGIWLGESAGGNGTLNLNGGVLITDRIRTGGAGTGVVNFNGGKLQATGDVVDILSDSANQTTTILAGGLKVGGSVNFTMSEALGGVGGMTKEDGNTVTYTGTASYTGTTTVSSGTLVINGNISTSTTLVSIGGTLAGSGTTGSVTVADGGILAPGTSPGTLTIDGDLGLNNASILNFELNPANLTMGSGVNDLVSVGSLTLDGLLNVTATSGSFAGVTSGTWTLFSYSGTLTDNILTLSSMPTLDAGYSWSLSTSTPGQINLTVVPEPGAALLGALSSLALLRRRRKG